MSFEWAKCESHGTGREKNDGFMIGVGVPNAYGWELNPWCYALYLENHNFPAGKLSLSNFIFFKNFKTHVLSLNAVSEESVKTELGILLYQMMGMQTRPKFYSLSEVQN